MTLEANQLVLVMRALTGEHIIVGTAQITTEAGVLAIGAKTADNHVALVQVTPIQDIDRIGVEAATQDRGRVLVELNHMFEFPDLMCYCCNKGTQASSMDTPISATGEGFTAPYEWLNETFDMYPMVTGTKPADFVTPLENFYPWETFTDYCWLSSSSSSQSSSSSSSGSSYSYSSSSQSSSSPSAPAVTAKLCLHTFRGLHWRAMPGFMEDYEEDGPTKEVCPETVRPGFMGYCVSLPPGLEIHSQFENLSDDFSYVPSQVSVREGLCGEEPLYNLIAVRPDRVPSDEYNQGWRYGGYYYKPINSSGDVIVRHSTYYSAKASGLVFYFGDNPDNETLCSFPVDCFIMRRSPICATYFNGQNTTLQLTEIGVQNDHDHYRLLPGDDYFFFPDNTVDGLSAKGFRADVAFSTDFPDYVAARHCEFGKGCDLDITGDARDTRTAGLKDGKITFTTCNGCIEWKPNAWMEVAIGLEYEYNVVSGKKSPVVVKTCSGPGNGIVGTLEKTNGKDWTAGFDILYQTENMGHVAYQELKTIGPVMCPLGACDDATWVVTWEPEVLPRKGWKKRSLNPWESVTGWYTDEEGITWIGGELWTLYSGPDWMDPYLGFDWNNKTLRIREKLETITKTSIAIKYMNGVAEFINTGTVEDKGEFREIVWDISEMFDTLPDGYTWPLLRTLGLFMGIHGSYDYRVPVGLIHHVGDCPGNRKYPVTQESSSSSSSSSSLMSQSSISRSSSSSSSSSFSSSSSSESSPSGEWSSSSSSSSSSFSSSSSNSMSSSSRSTSSRSSSSRSRSNNSSSSSSRSSRSSSRSRSSSSRSSSSRSSSSRSISNSSSSRSSASGSWSSSSSSSSWSSSSSSRSSSSRSSSSSSSKSSSSSSSSRSSSSSSSSNSSSSSSSHSSSSSSQSSSSSSSGNKCVFTWNAYYNCETQEMTYDPNAYSTQCVAWWGSVTTGWQLIFDDPNEGCAWFYSQVGDVCTTTADCTDVPQSPNAPNPGDCYCSSSSSSSHSSSSSSHSSSSSSSFSSSSSSMSSSSSSSFSSSSSSSHDSTLAYCPLCTHTGSITLTVSGFTGDCAPLNGTIELPYTGPASWWGAISGPGFWRRGSVYCDEYGSDYNRRWVVFIQNYLGPPYQFAESDYTYAASPISCAETGKPEGYGTFTQVYSCGEGGSGGTGVFTVGCTTIYEVLKCEHKVHCRFCKNVEKLPEADEWKKKLVEKYGAWECPYKPKNDCPPYTDHCTKFDIPTTKEECEVCSNKTGEEKAKHLQQLFLKMQLYRARVCPHRAHIDGEMREKECCGHQIKAHPVFRCSLRSWLETDSATCNLCKDKPNR